MSNRNPDSNYSQLDQALEFCFRQESKNIHTALPGLIEEYDPDAKRAAVQIAINMLVGNLESHESHPRPILLNIPVIWPSGGGYTMLFPLTRGDPVMLIFSERGIEKFKDGYQVSDPTIEAMFEERDAVALPGFGAMMVAPASETGACLQSEDGRQSVVVDGENIAVTATGDVSITAGGAIRLTGQSVTVAGSTDTLVVP